MKNLNVLNPYRVYSRQIIQYYGGAGDETCGVFLVPSCIDRAELKIVASSGMSWDHVSISRRNRCPNWQEMEQIASLFFKDDETAMQLHVPASDHVNNHPFCLHWWRPHDAEIPRPPASFVGVKDAGVLTPETASALQIELAS